MTGLLMEKVAALARNSSKVTLGHPNASLIPKLLLEDICRNTAIALRGATRFVLTNPMVDLALDLAEGPVSRLAAAMELVRAPAPSWWMEWDEHHRQQEIFRRAGFPEGPNDLETVADRVGILMTPAVERGGLEIGVQSAMCCTDSTPYGINLLPTGWQVKYGDPDYALELLTKPEKVVGTYRLKKEGNSSNLEDALQGLAEILLGSRYCLRQITGLEIKDIKEERFSREIAYRIGQDEAIARHQDLQRLAGYGATTLTQFAGAWISLARRSKYIDEPDIRRVLDETVETTMREQSGDFRFVMAVLATMQAAGDAVTITEGARPAKGPGSQRTLSRSPVTHKLITLKIHPNEVRRRWAERERVARESPRWHSFRGTRCYSKKRGDPKCEHTWFRPDETRDFHVCAKCDMRSWPRSGGYKGDKTKGEVEKVFLVKP